MTTPRNVLITGASGWTGKHLSQLALDRGAQVVGTVFAGSAAPRVAERRVDLTRRSAVEAVVAEVRPDWVFHLAAILPDAVGRRPVEAFISVNVTATYYLLDAVSRLAPKARVLVASSSAVYGSPAEPDQPITEGAPFQPQSLYATTKVAQDVLASQFFTEQGLHTVRGRTFNQTGPGEGANLVCGALARQIARIEAGLQEPALRAITLTPRRDFCDVRDVVAGYWAALEHGCPGQAYNICSGQSYSIRRVAEILVGLSRVAGIRLTESGPAPGPRAILNQIGCRAPLEACSGWRPAIPLEQSLRDLLEDWRTHPSNSLL